MKALVLKDAMRLEYDEVPKPALRDADDVIVRVRAAAICGSDVHGMDGSTGRRRPPVVMGHEASGEIVETGQAVKRFRVGERVTFDSTEYCGKCFHCLRGEVNLCDDRRVLGVSCAEYRRDGAFAEYLAVPERILYRIPEGLDFVSAALAEPAAVAAHAVARAPRALGETVAVIGSGLIGLLLIQVLKATEAGLVIAFDTAPDRREAALRFGADLAFDPADPASLPELLRRTGGRGADRAYEAVGASAPVGTAIESLRKGGALVLVGNLAPRIDFPLQTVVTRQVSIYGSCALAGEYPFVLDLMARGMLDARALVSAVAPLSDGAAWFSRLYEREAGLLKVVLEP